MFRRKAENLVSTNEVETAAQEAEQALQQSQQATSDAVELVDRIEPLVQELASKDRRNGFGDDILVAFSFRPFKESSFSHHV